MPRLSWRMLLAPLAAAMFVGTGPSPAAAASEARTRGKAVEVAYGYLASLSTDPRGPGGAPPYAYGVEVGSDGGPAPGADFLADRRALARR